METHLALRRAKAMALRPLSAAHEGRSGLLLTAETELLSCRRVSDVALIKAGKKKHHAVMLLLLFAALGGRIPATVLLLLIATHSVVISFTGGGKSSVGMANDQRPWSLGFLLLYCPLTSLLISPSFP
jgi:hypothetical protein